MKLLITGGAGFIGSNFVHYMRREHPTYELTNVDLLTYAGNLDNLAEIPTVVEGYRFVRADIADRESMEQLFAEGFDAVVNLAAESHVDRSILQPDLFIRSNVMGTQVLLDCTKKFGVAKFVQVSTDEVYGTLGADGLFSEQSPLAANSPYSASKAGADLLVRAYHETFGLAINITRCSNNYGPFQFPEKLIPHMISQALANNPLPVYGDGQNVRDWLYVEDHCRAIDLVLHSGRNGEVYNVGGNNERTNLHVVRTILSELGRPDTLISYVEDRLGHDRRYAIDATKIHNELGWNPRYDYETGIRKTIRWYMDNHAWLKRIATGAYRRNG